MIQVGIVGGTGYTGVELLRLLARHPEISIRAITSRAEAGKSVSDLFPNLRKNVDICFSDPKLETLLGCDIVFFATPNGTAMGMARALLASGVRIIDLAADFRLTDPSEWHYWYGVEHTCPELLTEAVYGLPEVNRQAIRSARLVANPGCYPTAVQLGFLPLIEKSLVDTQFLVADAKSGVSGAGRKAAVNSLFCEATESLKAYAVPGHRHLPEIVQELNKRSQKPVRLTFVPHLTPMVRGIHATLYAVLQNDVADLQSLYESRYASEPFVDVMPAGAHPETRSVRGANLCRIAIHRPQGGDTVVVLSVIDNLVKGAAGQAIQNMNLMCGFPEALGLEGIALLP
ncbi:N-acetyl-gamma-glutamyl-phosphate reductase [Gammaproteobacteria bacterium]